MALNRISRKSEQLIKAMLTVESDKRIGWKELFKAFNCNEETSKANVDDKFKKEVKPDRLKSIPKKLNNKKIPIGR